MSGPILVLGMHRSGTSSLTGSLEEAGLYLGDVKRENRDNLKGNRENRDIVLLHRAILEHCGTTWDRLPVPEITWTDAQLAERDRIIASYPEGRAWGFKDPRTILLLEGWRAALPTARFVGSFRHPAAVAASLLARDRIPIKRGLALWRVHNRKLLDLSRVQDVPLIDFDAPPARYLETLTDIVRRLGLTPPTEFRFYEPRLRSAPPDIGTELPEGITRLYRALGRQAG